MWLPPAISFPVQIPDFYAKSRSLYANFSMFPSKWSSFVLQSSMILFNEFSPLIVSPSIRGGRCRKSRGMGGFEWVSSRRCVRCDFGVKYLLCQTHYQARCPLRFLVPQGTWVSISDMYPGLPPRECNFNQAVKTSCDTQNGFVHFHGAMSRLKVGSTTSASLLIIPSTDRTNGENFLCWP